MTARPRSGAPVVAVYRTLLLPRSETFIRAEALALERYAPLFVGEQAVEDGLALPEGSTVVATAHPLLRRVPGQRARVLARACQGRDIALVHAHFGTDSLLALDVAKRLRVPLVTAPVCVIEPPCAFTSIVVVAAMSSLNVSDLCTNSFASL